MKSVVKLNREFILAGFLPKIAKIVTKSVMNIPGSREMYPNFEVHSSFTITFQSDCFHMFCKKMGYFTQSLLFPTVAKNRGKYLYSA
jgi:hypothetical protein